MITELTCNTLSAEMKVGSVAILLMALDNWDRFHTCRPNEINLNTFLPLGLARYIAYKFGYCIHREYSYEDEAEETPIGYTLKTSNIT